MTYREESRLAYNNAKLGDNESRVLGYIQQMDPIGVTCDQFMAISEMPHQSASPAFTSLERRGLIRRTTHRVRTRSGSLACTYTLCNEPLFSTATRKRSDLFRDVIRAAMAARHSGDWSSFDSAFGALPSREQTTITKGLEQCERSI